MKHKLFVRNLKVFFDQNFESQFNILSQLEKTIQENNFEKEIRIHHNTGEHVLFELKNVSYHPTRTIFTYDYIKQVANG